MPTLSRKVSGLCIMMILEITVRRSYYFIIDTKWLLFRQPNPQFYRAIVPAATGRHYRVAKAVRSRLHLIRVSPVVVSRSQIDICFLLYIGSGKTTL